MYASAIWNTVLMSCTDKDGQDLLSQSEFTETISIFGEASQSNIPFSIKTLKIGESEKHYLEFNADLPDKKDMIFDESGKEATGTSSSVMKIGDKTLSLKCSFRFRNSVPENYGNNAITLESIEGGGLWADDVNNRWNSSFIVLDVIY